MSEVFRRIELVRAEIQRLDQLGDDTFNDVITIHEERLRNLIDKTAVYRINQGDNRVVPGGICKN
ncbi:MAG: hypothetical protein WDZ47_01015 [Bacteroidales bacterium]